MSHDLMTNYDACPTSSDFTLILLMQKMNQRVSDGCMQMISEISE